MAAARRKGKWSGGLPVLGYDVDASPPGVVAVPVICVSSSAESWELL